MPPPEDDEDKKENGANGADKDETDKKEEKETKEGQDLDDDDIAKVESMMRRLQAVREAGEGMDEAQRRRMAARAVQEVMKEL